MTIPKVAVIDYGMGNLFSVVNACASVGLNGHITKSADDLMQADAVILPGVGAFNDAMINLEKLKLIDIMKQIIASQKPFLAICLGFQLLMEESFEFGHHQGMGVIKGSVERFKNAAPCNTKDRLKVPQVGWNKIIAPKHRLADNHWHESLLKGIPQEAYMYFVHSFYVTPSDQSLMRSVTQYGHTEFCSSIQDGNLFACQFHPERSGPVGLMLYTNFAESVRRSKENTTCRN